MKKFHLPLDRVLELRRTQVHIEQTKLERMLMELRTLESQAANIKQQVDDSARSVIKSQSVPGVELEALQHSRNSAAAKSTALGRDLAGCVKRLQAQRDVIALKERDVRLLEKLREDRLRAWGKAQDREIDQEAEESFRARWNK